MDKYAGKVEGERKETLDMRDEAEVWIQHEAGLGYTDDSAV